MKKVIITVFTLLLLISLIGCGSNNQQPANQVGTGHATGNSNVKLINENSSDATASTNTDSGSTSAPSEGADSNQEASDSSSLSKPDIDISTVGTSIIYSKAADIAANYSSYLGKTIRIKGTYNIENGQNRNYYYCLVNDSTACCSAGFEFVLKNNSKPNLKKDQTFIVQGKLHSYKEGDNVFLELIDSTIVK